MSGHRPWTPIQPGVESSARAKNQLECHIHIRRADTPTCKYTAKPPSTKEQDFTNSSAVSLHLRKAAGLTFSWIHNCSPRAPVHIVFSPPLQELVVLWLLSTGALPTSKFHEWLWRGLKKVTKKARLLARRTRLTIKDSAPLLGNVCGHVMNTVPWVKSVFFPVMLDFLTWSSRKWSWIHP